jgi:hypothetical protein
VLTTASFAAAVSYFFQLVPRWLCRLPKLAKVQHRFVVRADINVISTGEACRRGFAAGIDKLADAVAITLGPCLACFFYVPFSVSQFGYC